MHMKYWSLLTVALSLAGCGGFGAMRENADQIRELDKIAVSSRTGMAKSEGYVRDMDGLYFSGAKLPLSDRDVLPSVFHERLVLRSDVPMRLQDVAEYISRNHGVRVNVASDAVEHSSKAISGLSERLGRTLEGGQFFLSVECTLEELLQDVTARTGTWWRYRDGAVTIGYLDTRVFEIKALALKTSLSRTVSNASAGGASGGGSNTADAGGSVGSAGQTLTTTVELETYKAVEEGIKGILSPKGKYALSPASGSLVVTDSADTLDRVATLMTSINARFSRQVFIDVSVVSIELRDSDSYGIDWTLVRESLNGRTAFSGITTSAVPAGANSVGIEVIDPAYNYAGSGLLIQALAEQGNLAVQYSDSALTVSGRPISVRIGDQIGYIAENNRTVVPNVGVIFETKSGIVNTGLAMTILPQVSDSNEVLMQVDFSLTTLRELRKLGDPANGGVEQPTIAPREMSSTISLKSGATVAIRGIEQDSTRSDSRGIGSPTFTLLGGGANGEKRRTVLLILLTPRVQEG